MRLKSIDIKGFKSFANATQINFEEDVIGVVGPNGSGKSNIIDAIRWVLGEQKSKELRLSSMSDVLFNGTRKRRAANSAQVTIHFENTKNLLPTDYNEVAISRILYRNGESEYRINDVSCRLKDIRSLFLDSGIGSNSYAIIALGMVDDLLADREGARRMMFEQAAGISKYKYHKKETLKRLKQTEDDLVRLEDLVYEIESNLKALEKQARRAKRYKVLKEEYHKMAVDAATLQINQYKKNYDELRAKIQSEKESQAGLSNQINQLEAQIQDKKAGHIHLEQNLSSAQKEINKLVAQIRHEESNHKSASEKLEYLRKTLGEDQKQLQELVAKQESSESNVGALQAKGRDLTDQLGKEQHLLEQAKEELEGFKGAHLANKEQLNTFASELKKVENSMIEVERIFAIAVSERNNYQLQLKNLDDDTLRFSDSVNALRENLEAINKQWEEANRHVERTTEQVERKEKDKSQLIADKEGLREKLGVLRRQLDAKTNERNLLKGMIDNLEGFPESTKFLSKSKHWKQRSILVSDLLVCDEDYRVALEMYLENYLNCFVVESREEAYQSIELLRENQKGRAGFVLRNKIPPVHAPDRSLPFIPAIDVVEYDETNQSLLEWLLAGVYLVQNEADLKGLNASDNLIFLTQSGRIFESKCELRGGSVGLFEGKKIGRNKQLKSLEKEINTLEKEVGAKQSKLDSIIQSILEIEHEKNIKKELNELIKRRAYLENQQTRLDAELKVKQEQLSASDNRRLDLSHKLNATKEKIESLELQKAVEERQYLEVKEKTESLDSIYQKDAELYSALSSKYNEQNITFIRLQNEVKTIDNERTILIKQQEDQKSSINRLKAKITNNKNEQGDLIEDKKNLDLTLKRWYEQRKEKEQSLTQVEKEYFQAKGTVMELEDQLKKINKNHNSSQQLIDQLRDKYLEVKVEINRISERAQVEFGIEESDLLEYEVISDTPIEELLASTIKLREKIAQFGEVNPMAIEAYDEINQRYETIIDQRTDVLKAKASLLETIAEIEQTAQERFMVAFEEVKVNFRNVFRALFTREDTCDLILTEPDNPLTSPIEIIAKPKGKRPKTLAQLSGGEKTLTAVALLFSLYLLKPAPFCIFDEVDAPLDDANIEKFNRIIREFSGDSQFIIVTHNKLTMAAVDVIYGVYMEEMGISNVSAVDFRHLEHEVVFETV